MHITLFKALKNANISDDAAEKVVHAFEEHIDMAVAEAIKHYDQRLTAMQAILEARLESGLKGVQTSIDVLKWYIVVQGSLMAAAVATGGILTAYFQFIK